MIGSQNIDKGGQVTGSRYIFMPKCLYFGNKTQAHSWYGIHVHLQIVKMLR